MLPAICLENTTKETWETRREELVELFRKYEFGRRPEIPYRVEGTLLRREPALQGRAKREIYAVTISTARGEVTMELALILPDTTGPVPVVMLLSNHDREALPTAPPDMGAMQQVMEQAPAQWRESTQKMLAGMMGSGEAPKPELLDITGDEGKDYWAVEEILASGRAAAAFYANQAQIDDRTQFPSQLAALFLDPEAPRGEDGWGTLGVWAFAASCMVDVLEKHPQIDPKKISLAGHSRGGKTVLWCAAQDTRINGVLVNNSGCSGAALSRGKEGEVVASINAFFPHWFCPNYRAFGWKEEVMPFDQHMLLAAVAPRLCCVTSGSEDGWSDPQAEWKGAVAAGEAWQLFGYPTLSGPCPEPGEMRYDSPIAYHKRQGGHDLTAWDWRGFMTFLDKHNG